MIGNETFEDLVGKVLTKVENISDDQIIFYEENGDRYILYHSQDCCESVTVEDIIGDLDDLVGVPILMADEAKNYSSEDSGDSETWTFYKLATIKGYVTIRWYGTSNGYYSEEVSFRKM